jgi:septal ring factor EnvC (AmiA/AmiB activator)
VKRRLFITAAMASSAAIAGCSGDRVDELESRLTERKQELQTVRGRLNETEAELEQVNGALKSARTEIDETEAELGDIEDQLENIRGELTAQETATAEARRREVVRFYGYGITFQNAALGTYQEANNSAQDDDYVIAAERYAAAFAQYDASNVLFNEAGELSSSLNRVTVQEYCATAERAMSLMSDACEQYEIAARRLANGQDATSYANTGDQFFNDREELEVKRRGVIESELGVAIQTDNRA